MRKMWLLQSLTKLSVFLDEWFECLSHYIGGHDADGKAPMGANRGLVEREVNRARLTKNFDIRKQMKTFAGKSNSFVGSPFLQSC